MRKKVGLMNVSSHIKKICYSVTFGVRKFVTYEEEEKAAAEPMVATRAAMESFMIILFIHNL